MLPGVANGILRREREKESKRECVFESVCKKEIQREGLYVCV